MAEMVGVEPTRLSRDLKHFECCRLCIPSTNLVELGGSSWKFLFPFPRQILTHFPPKMEVQRPYLNPTQFFRFCSKNTPFFARRKELGKNSSTKVLHLPLAIPKGASMEYHTIPANKPQGKWKEKRSSFAGIVPRRPFL